MDRDVSGAGRAVSNAELRELLGAYAINALDDDERALVESHLAESATLREELVPYLDAAAALGSTVEQTPSAATWDRILTQVRADGPRVAGDPRFTASLAPKATATAAPDRNVADHHAVPLDVAPVIALDAARETRRFRRRTIGRTIAAGAIAAAVAVPVTLSFAGGSSPSIAALGRRASKEPGARSVPLRNAAGLQVARAVLTSTGRGYLLADSLPALPAGSTYQLWAITGAKPVSAGVLGRDPGDVAFTVDAPASALAVSVEPAEGSTQPTHTPVASGTIST